MAWIKDRGEESGSRLSREFFYDTPSAGRTRVRNSLDRMSEYALDSRGRPTEAIDARDTKTKLEWDDSRPADNKDDNKIIRVTAAIGTDDEAVREFTWNANGSLLESKDGNGRVTTLSYRNSAGHSSHLSLRTVSGGTASIDAGRGFVSDLETVTSPRGFTTTYTYDDPADSRGNVRFRPEWRRRNTRTQIRRQRPR